MTSTNARHAWWNRQPDRFIRIHSLPSPLLLALLRRAGI